MTLLALSATRAAKFPYHGATFDAFVKDSYRVVGRANPNEFFQVMDERAVKAGLPTWEKWPSTHKPTGTADDAKDAGAEVWHRIKKTITKFSLDRGFEFANAITTNERQCYLQSIIVAGELQKAGYDAGVAMVWSNPKGQTSNNGHAVAVVRTGAKDIVVDCSEPKPFEVHRGLFMRMGDGYKYVEPVYDAQEWITAYRVVGTGETVAPSRMTLLDLPFLESQFDYYRGERAIGGVISKAKTPAGLAASERFYRKSLKECPQNPLTVAMLARTLVAESKPAAAQNVLQAARKLYAADGWTPNDVKNAVVKL